MSSITCRAAIALKANEPLSVEDVIVAAPRAGEARVRILHSAVCHTDLYTWSGQDSEGIFPCILGHEGAGVVESIGEGVTSVAVGDHVVPLYTPECRTCKFCTATGVRTTNLCSRIRGTQGKGLMPDGTSRFTRASTGESIAHFMGCSTFSEYTVVPEIALAVVPRDVPLSRVCLLGCGVTTGFGAVLNTADVEEHAASAAVFGLGAVGLAVILGLRKRGVKKVLAIDVNPAKFAAAVELGGPAVVCVNPRDYPGRKISEVVVELTTEDGWGGAHYTFECVGSVELMRAALEASHRAWGVSVIIGVAPAGTEIATRPFQLVTGRTWKGTAFGGVKGRSGMSSLVAAYKDGTLPLDKFVTHEYAGVEALNDAFHVMHDAAANALRPVITYKH